MPFFYFFAALLVIQAILSLRGGVRYLSYVRRETATEARGFTPFASVIAPCRGLDQGLRENLCALFTQDYPAYEIIFVTDSADDASYVLIEEVRAQFKDRTNVSARVHIAGAAKACG